MSTIDVSKKFAATTVKVGKDVNSDVTFKNDVAGQFLVEESGNDVKITVYGQKDNPLYESYAYTRVLDTPVTRTVILVEDDGLHPGMKKVTTTVGTWNVDHFADADPVVQDNVDPGEAPVGGTTYVSTQQKQAYDFDKAAWVNTADAPIAGTASAVATVPAGKATRYTNGSAEGVVIDLALLAVPDHDNGLAEYVVDTTTTWGTVLYKGIGVSSFLEDKGTASATVTGDVLAATNLFTKNYTAQLKGTAYTGSGLDETAATSAKNDTYALGTGTDKIDFMSTAPQVLPFGKDTVTLSEKENLTLDFTQIADNRLTATLADNGKDIEVKAYATAIIGYEEEVVTVAGPQAAKVFTKNSIEYSAAKQDVTYTKTAHTYADGDPGYYIETVTEYTLVKNGEVWEWSAGTPDVKDPVAGVKPANEYSVVATIGETVIEDGLAGLITNSGDPRNTDYEVADVLHKGDKYYLKATYTNAVYDKTDKWDHNPAAVLYATATEVPAAGNPGAPVIAIVETVNGHQTHATYTAELPSYDVDTLWVTRQYDVNAWSGADYDTARATLSYYEAIDKDTAPSVKNNYYKEVAITTAAGTTYERTYLDGGNPATKTGYGDQYYGEESLLGTVVLKDLAAKDVLAIGEGGIVNVKGGSTRNVLNMYISEAVKKGTTYTGTYLNETVTGTTDSEKFDLKTGNDTIIFNRTLEKDAKQVGFGDDQVVLSELSALQTTTLKFYNVDAYGHVDIAVDGSDIVISTLSNDGKESRGSVKLVGAAAKDLIGAGKVAVKFYTNEGVTSLDGGAHDLDDIRSYTFAVAGKGGKFTGTWLNDIAESTKDNETFELKGNAGAGKNVAVFSLAGDGFGEDTLKAAVGEKTILRFDNVGATDVISSKVEGKDVVVYATNADGSKTYGKVKITGAAAKNILDDAAKGIDGNLEIKAYSDAGITPAVPAKDVADIFADLVYAPTADKSGTKYTGTWLNENVVATNKDETFKLGGGTNTYDFTAADIGSNVVELTAGETAKLAFKTVDPIFFIDKQDLIAVAPEGEVRIKNYLKDPSAVNVQISIAGGAYGALTADPNFILATTFDADDLEDTNGKFKGTALSETVNAAGYIPEKGEKGVNINSGSGNDTLTGSSFNDTITSNGKAGEVVAVTEIAGNNKIKTGKSNDTINANGMSSNNINTGEGNDVINLNSIGVNKVQAGKGNKNININGGNNDVKVTGVANVTVATAASVNKISTGKENDIVTINFNSTNTIKSQGGNDNITINAGVNTVDAGAGNDTITITGASRNFVKGGAGDDAFIFTNAAGSYTSVDAGAGNDSYDFTTFDFTEAGAKGSAVITDKNGNVDITLAAQKSAFFDVKGKFDKKTNTFTVGKLGDEITFYTDDNNDGVLTGGTAKIKTGAKSNITVTCGVNDYTFSKDALAQKVCAWLTANQAKGYTSAMDVINSGNAADITSIMAVYTGNSADCYIPQA